MTTGAYVSKTRYLVSRGKGLGLPLAPREAEMVLAVMDGNTSVNKLIVALACKKGTINFFTNQIYGKTGARNLADLVLMITGVLDCPVSLLPVQRAWRRKHYKIDE